MTSRVFLAAAGLGLAAACGPLAQAAPPMLYQVQGHLSDSQGRPLTGAHLLRFKLWDSMAGGRQIWEESQYVSVTAGVYDAVVGRLRPMPAHDLGSGYRLAVEPPDGTGWVVQGVRLFLASQPARPRAARPEPGGAQSAAVESAVEVPVVAAPEYGAGQAATYEPASAQAQRARPAAAGRREAQPKPEAAPPAFRPRIYVVKPNDTLMTIARDLYGDPEKWLDLYHANFDRIQRGGDITAGQKLVIP